MYIDLFYNENMEVKINGININYEEAGKGKPIILLHGNGETHEIFDKLYPFLVEDGYHVYALDSRCHGKSQDTQEISYELMAGDVLAFLSRFKLDKPTVIGFSDGAIVALMMEIKKPGSIGKMVISGANTSPHGLVKKWYRFFKLNYFFHRDKKVKMIISQPHITDQQLGMIKCPVLITAGEKDMVDKRDTRRIYLNIHESELLFLKKETHDSYIVHNPKYFQIIKPFLDKKEA